MAVAVQPVKMQWFGQVDVYLSDTGAPPTVPGDGTFKVGDIIMNAVPTAGGTFCWVCITAGAGGTAAFKTVAIGA